MQARKLGRLAAPQPAAQEVGEQMVIAIPVAVVVKRHREDIPLLQALQDRHAVICVFGWGRQRVGQHCIAQIGAHPVEDRGVEQEALDRLRLTPDDLRHQVIHDIAIAAGEGGDEALGVGAALQRESGHLESGHPAFRASLQQRQVLGRKPQAHDLSQKSVGLVDAELQVSGADFRDQPAAAEARERERRVGAGCDHEARIGGQMVNDIFEGLMDGAVINDVIVVEHDHQARWRCAQGVEQEHQHLLGRWWLNRMQRRGGRGAQSRRRDIHGGEQVLEEAENVVVVLVERKPGDAIIAGQRVDRGVEQCRLAETGRRRDQGQWPGQTGDQFGLQIGTRHQVLARRRHVSFGHQQRRRGARVRRMISSHSCPLVSADHKASRVRCVSHGRHYITNTHYAYEGSIQSLPPGESTRQLTAAASHHSAPAAGAA